MPSFRERLQHAWNVFTDKEPPVQYRYVEGGYGIRPDRKR